jgi:hypothetical protein
MERASASDILRSLISGIVVFPGVQRGEVTIKLGREASRLSSCSRDSVNARRTSATEPQTVVQRGNSMSPSPRQFGVGAFRAVKTPSPR